MKKNLPKLKSDKQARHFLEKDLSDYLDRKNFVLTSFEYAPKDTKITLRLSSGLLQNIKAKAKKAGMDYQKLIRQAIERFLKDVA